MYGYFTPHWLIRHREFRSTQPYSVYVGCHPRLTHDNAAPFPGLINLFKVFPVVLKDDSILDDG